MFSCFLIMSGYPVVKAWMGVIDQGDTWQCVLVFSCAVFYCNSHYTCLFHLYILAIVIFTAIKMYNIKPANLFLIRLPQWNIACLFLTWHTVWNYPDSFVQLWTLAKIWGSQAKKQNGGRIHFISTVHKKIQGKLLNSSRLTSDILSTLLSHSKFPTLNDTVLIMYLPTNLCAL